MSNKPTEQELIDTWLHHYIMPAIADGVSIALRGIEKYGSADAMMEDGTDYDDWINKACDENVSELFAELRAKGFTALDAVPPTTAIGKGE